MPGRHSLQIVGIGGLSSPCQVGWRQHCHLLYFLNQNSPANAGLFCFIGSCYDAYGVGVVLNCCISPDMSAWFQRSTIAPPAIRSIVIPVNVIVLPVAGIPMKGPVCVPRNVHRQATLFPSATRSSIVEEVLEKAAPNMVTSCL